MKVSLFVTCLADQFYPRTAIAVVKLLEYFGCTVDFPKAQTCCGQPMFNTGFQEETRGLAKRMVEVFEPAEYVVTPSGSCAAMVREYYPQLLGNEPAYQKGMLDLVNKTYEFVEFLVDVLKVDLSKEDIHWPGHATYHYSCHLRGLGIAGGGEKIQQLFVNIKEMQYSPLDKIEQCCGFGGTFATKYPQMSGSMVREKVACIRDTKATTVISNDAGCTMNISGACQREKYDVQFITLAEILAEGLGLLKSDCNGQTPKPRGSSCCETGVDEVKYCGVKGGESNG